jgi:hypothetical protein
MNTMKFTVGLILSVLLLYFAVSPLFGTGYFPMHDDTQVARVIAMGDATRDLQFPVRVVDHLGYGLGYPIFAYYSPLPYYAGGILYALGIDAYVATKMMFMLGFVLAAALSFILFASQYGVLSAVVGSVIFSYAPYHAVQLYIRGSVGEFWAAAFLPLFVLGIISIRAKNTYAGIFLGSIGLAAIFLSHTILGVLTLLIFFLCIVAEWIRQLIARNVHIHVFVHCFAVVMFGMGLSAFFWLPAFLEMNTTSVTAMIQSAQTGFYDHFLCATQLWNSPWGFGGSSAGCIQDGMSFKLGKLHILFALVSVLLFLYQRYRRTRTSGVLYPVSLTVLILTILGMLPVSEPFWKLLPFTSFIQYPWRLLTVAMFALGGLGAYVMTGFRSKPARYAMSAVLIGLTIYVNAKNFVPNYIYEPDRKMLNTSEDLLFRVSKISDEYLPSAILKPKSLAEVPTSLVSATAGASISIQKQTATYASISVSHDTKHTILIQKAYIPGWKFWVDDVEEKPVIIRGLPAISLKEGSHTVVMEYKNTAAKSQGEIISIMTIVLLGGLLFYGQKNKT